MSFGVNPAMLYAFLDAIFVDSIVVKLFLLCRAIVSDACVDAFI